MKLFAKAVALLAAAAVLAVPSAAGSMAAPRASVSVNWSRVIRISRTVPTTQHLASAYTLRSHPLNNALLKDLRDLHTNDTRLQLWYPLVRQAVAELKAPTRSRTFWDFHRSSKAVVAGAADRIVLLGLREGGPEAQGWHRTSAGEAVSFLSDPGVTG
jgi:hypothetical protein